jgi:hypothetical protein
MQIKELLPDFKRRFDDAMAAIIASGQEVPSDRHQAQNFLDRLSPAYNNMNLEYKNKLRAKPRTLAEAYQAAAERRMLSTQGLAVPVSDATVFMMKGSNAHSSDSDDNDLKSSDKKKKNKNRNKTKGEKEPAVVTAVVPATEPDKPATTKKPTRDCALCTDRKKPEDRRHWISDCPRLPEFKDLIKDGTIAHAQGTPYEPFGDEDVVVL